MGKKVLIIFAHPNFDKSKANRAFLDTVSKNPDVTIHSLYEKYSNFKIDVPAEQKLLTEHDAVILQFPFYWYGSPALLKEWMDVVLAFNFAFGPTNKMKGKTISVVTTTGSKYEDYMNSGKYKCTVEDLLRPFELTAEFCEMKNVKPFVMHGIQFKNSDLDAVAKIEADLKKRAVEYSEFVARIAEN
jgi:glutathione-regulated potassium-efflux system ancillary protein KefG